MQINVAIVFCMNGNIQEPGVKLWLKREDEWIKRKQTVPLFHINQGSCMKEVAPLPPHTEKLYSVAGCVTWILLSALLLVPVGNGSFCVYPNGKMICCWLVQNQSIRVFFVSDSKDQPTWKLMQSLRWTNAVCSHWGNSRYISEEAARVSLIC